MSQPALFRYCMKEITSRENRIYKLCVRLGTRKYREREGLYIAEGPNVVREAIEFGAGIEQIIISSDAAGNGEIGELAGMTDAPAALMAAELFAKISDTENSQGIIALIRVRETDGKAFFNVIGPDGSAVILDRLQDPGNIGTILRTARAAGYGGAIVVKGTGDVYAPKTARAAAGALFVLPVLRVESGRAAAEAARSAGMRVAVTDAADAPGCLDYRDAELAGHIALVIGNEGNGVSEELSEAADIKVHIPMAAGTESLNAAVAAGILMYERVRAGR